MQEWIKNIDKIEFLSNSLLSLIIFGLIILIGIIFRHWFSRLLSRLIFKFFRRYAEDVSIDNFIDLLKKPLAFLIILIFIGLACQRLVVPVELHLISRDHWGVLMFIDKSYMILLISSVIWILLRIVDFFGLILLKKAEKTESKTDDQLIPFIIDALKILIVIMGIFIVLGSVFKLNIGSLIAGLGIGGLAIALAAKETLENLLGSFTIFMDKPFTLGDLVKIGDITGVVEKVGFRSTRIRTLEKSFVTVPNKRMIDAELDNLSLRTFQRAKFDVNISYKTTIEQVKKIVEEIQAYIDNHEYTNEDGVVKFTGFGASSLEIMVIFYVNSMDWNLFLQIKQEINFKIMEIIEKNGSSLAIPTTNVIMDKN
jgi:MscS family membrane protein